MTTLIVGITGASGTIFGVRLMEVLQAHADVETHLIISKWGQQTLEHETSWTAAQVQALASHVHAPGDMGATISSGSVPTDGMVVAPCSMRTLAAIAHGFGDNLIQRAADVTLKEGRRLVLVPREMPLSAVHLENMLKLARMGVCILPPVPAFYNHPESLDDMVDHVVGRILDQFGLPADFERRWDGVLKKNRIVPLRRAE